MAEAADHRLWVEIGTLAGAAFIIEEVFDRPGLGRLVPSGAGQRDDPLVQATAPVFTLAGRGVTRPGAVAEMVIFRHETAIDRAASRRRCSWPPVSSG